MLLKDSIYPVFLNVSYVSEEKYSVCKFSKLIEMQPKKLPVRVAMNANACPTFISLILFSYDIMCDFSALSYQS